MERTKPRVWAAGGSLTEAVEGAGGGLGNLPAESLVTKEKPLLQQANFNVKGARL